MKKLFILDFNFIKDNFCFVKLILNKRQYKITINQIIELETKNKFFVSVYNLVFKNKKLLIALVNCMQTYFFSKYCGNILKKIKYNYSNNYLNILKFQLLICDIYIKKLNFFLKKIIYIAWQRQAIVPNLNDDLFHHFSFFFLKPFFYFKRNLKKLITQTQLYKYKSTIIPKIVTQKFSLFYGDIARLHRALIAYMLDIHIYNGYTEFYLPYITNKDSLFSTGQYPKFSRDMFFLDNSSEFSLISTGEIPLTNLVRNLSINNDFLPYKFVTHTSCFRKEAGSYGQKDINFIRQHQFEKVELVQIVNPVYSKESFESLLYNVKFLLCQLNLPYRIINIPSYDLGFSATKTYDFEVWFPISNRYYEVSSCSWFSDFQGKRMLAKFYSKNTQKTEFLHTINGSGLAIGRILIAILENYWQENLIITIPVILQQYMDGLQTIIF